MALLLPQSDGAGPQPYSPPSPLIGMKRPSEERLQPPNPPNPADLSGASEDDSLALLPKHTVVRVVGNARTKAAFVGQRAVVKRAVGLGGWHWLVLATGEEIKLQRNALLVLEYPTGNEPDFSDDEEEEEQQRLMQARHVPLSTSVDLPPPAEKSRQRRPPRPAIEDAGVRRLSQRGAGQPRCNLSKLDKAALLRYQRFYKLPEAAASSSKDDLVQTVEEHFSAQEVDEAEVIACFLRAAKRHHMGLLHTV